MEPRPDFEALKYDFEAALPRRTARDVVRAMLDGAMMAFYGLHVMGLSPPERLSSHRLTKERYEGILQEFEQIDREATGRAGQIQSEQSTEE